MATPWPLDHDVFRAVRVDLTPLIDAYPDGEFFVPEGLEGLIDEPLVNAVSDRRAVGLRDDDHTGPPAR